MVSFLSRFCFSWRKEQKWRRIEDAAKHLDQLPSWQAPDNTLILQAFEWHVPADQRHWLRLQKALPEFKAIGIDHIWIPPGCKGMDPWGNGYDIYDLYDLGEFDQKGAIATKWGTRKELEDLISRAQALDIGVYWDAVLSHKAGADYAERFEAVKVDPEQRTRNVSEPAQISGWVGFDFTGRGNKYSSMKYNWNHFNGVDWDDLRQENAIYKVHAPKKDWAKDVSSEKGNFDYLMFANLDYSNPEVWEDVLNWGAWITTQLPLRGMRLDAAKHFSVDFQRQFVDRVRETATKEFFVIGEYWTGDIRPLVKYLEKMEYKVAAYDVPLVANFSKMSLTRGADLRDVFKDTLVQRKPDCAVTIVENHDTQPGQMLETPVTASFKPVGYALILLRKEGRPCVFYGDLYGIRANVKHPMRPACNGKLPTLLLARKLYAYGEQQDYFDKPNCIGFVRYGNARHPSGLACVISNAGPSQKRMYVGPQHAQEEWTDILQSHSGAVTIDGQGYGVFPVNATAVSVWVHSAAENRDRVQNHQFDENIYQD